ncbi:MAG TPA: PEP-utilizing enzyme [Solirubrobacteraceae bacterium]|nr:PEP-utilizing enzyme [Solirubrobacteraceae bacterium]
MTVSQAAPPAAPAPPDFPVAFAAGDEQLFWQQDKMHFPAQVLPLEGELMATAPGRGMTHAFRVYEAPMEAMRVRIEHGYVYNSIVPVPGEPEELEALGRRAESVLMPVMARLGDKWEAEWLPEIHRHLEVMEALDLATASVPELAAHLDEVVARYARLWEVHMELVLPAYLAISEFDEFHRDLVDGDTFDAYRLLQGIPSKTTEIALDLWRLSRVAVASPEVAGMLASTAAADVPAVLGRSDAGRVFLDALDEHLRRYGHRSATWGLAGASFIEDPAPVVQILKDYAAKPDGEGPDSEQERQAREREAAIGATRELLRAYPVPVREQFEALLAAAHAGIVLSEDHNFWIDFYASDLVRQTILELGRRLTDAGVLDAAHDALYLTLDELRTSARDPLTGRRALVAERRAHLAAYAGAAPPPVLGTLPPGPPPENPMMLAMGKFFGAPAAPAAEPGVIAGAAGAAGTVTGVARVVRTLDDAGRLAAGEVLVAQTTAPPWTPLFGVAAAVVTDTGGILSHCAVVAREYGIPAVVGTAVATAAIHDGDVVEVDGDAGTVRIVR